MRPRDDTRNHEEPPYGHRAMSQLIEGDNFVCDQLRGDAQLLHTTTEERSVPGDTAATRRRFRSSRKKHHLTRQNPAAVDDDGDLTFSFLFKTGEHERKVQQAMETDEFTWHAAPR